MASSSRPERAYHQDYIARVRYSNDLPPPPNPPKLLDIPNTGLSSGLYTSAGYASRLVREQPLNIEADAELGMPIDLVGLPGVFDGDETAIHAPAHPVIHPNDRALLRPLATLGKPSSGANTVSFLRRTEYVTSAAAKYSDISKDTLRPRSAKKRRLPNERQNDPIHILRSIIKGFDLAYPNEAYTGPDTTEHLRGAEIVSEERAAWKLPQHPTNQDLKLLDSYPVLPDVEAFADQIGSLIVKFTVPPVPAADKYDERLDVGIFLPTLNEARHAEIEARRAVDPSVTLAEPYDYGYFWPKKESIRGLKRKLNPADPDHADDALYDAESRDTEKPHFKYEKVRVYETHQQAETHGLFDDIVGMALHDGTSSGRSKAAYIYPVSQRVFLKPKRKGDQYTQLEQEIDAIEVTIRDFEDTEVAAREDHIKDKFAINV